MAKTKRKKSFLYPSCGGGFAGLILWYGLKKIIGESITWWMGLILMFICVAIGVVSEAIDDRKIKPDIVVRKKEQELENED